MKHIVLLAVLAPGIAAADVKKQKIVHGTACIDSDDEKPRPPATVPAGIKVAGVIETLATWTDRTGDHVAAFWTRDTTQDQTACQIETRQMQVDVFDLAGGKPKLVRSVKEPAQARCLDVSQTRFERNALAITDADNDGIAELVFSYTIGCSKGAATPATRKLVILEGKDRHSARGQTAVKRGGAKIIGTLDLEEGFAQQDALFEAATALWKRLADDDVK